VNRRAFLAALAGAVVAPAIAEELLWTPGKKLISIPSVVSVPFSMEYRVKWFHEYHSSLFALRKVRTPGGVLTEFHAAWRRYEIARGALRRMPDAEWSKGDGNGILTWKFGNSLVVLS